MEIFDKAKWQIDNGINEELVISHFEFIFEWLKNHNMLNQDGLDILDIGIDDDVSLHEGLLTNAGNSFLKQFYDTLISESQYQVECEKVLIDELYSKWNV